MKKSIIMSLSIVLSSSYVFGNAPQSEIMQNQTKITEERNTMSITEAEVILAQKAWGDAIVAIGKAYADGKDYKAIARNVVDTMYAYDEGRVLFKPTKAAHKQFRLTEDDAVSYFVTGSQGEDHGFALQPWSKVRFENSGIIIDNDSATAMGEYYFTDAKTGKEVNVEYTFGYIKDENGKLLINIHHSSMPYVPTH
ncbi:MAG: hypothetical protein ACWGHH_07070 [Sulfurovaceae bacterium]